MCLKVGDTVKIKENLEVNKQYGIETVTKGMLKYRGNLARIIAKVDQETYFLEGCDDWEWTKEMFEFKQESLTELE
jgi:hypothetical protein